MNPCPLVCSKPYAVYVDSGFKIADQKNVDPIKWLEWLESLFPGSIYIRPNVENGVEITVGGTACPIRISYSSSGRPTKKQFKFPCLAFKHEAYIT